jgi:hypothetical protein
LLDDDDGPERYPDDPDGPAVLPRKPKPSLLKKMAGDASSVGSSLDSFITKANEGLLDVKDNPPSRERDLEARVAELEKMVVVAEARAKKAEATRTVAAEPVMPIAPQSRGWGGIAVAFALGCGAMFAVSTFVLKKEPEKMVSVPAGQHPDSETGATVTPLPAPTPDPAPTPPPTPTEQTAVVAPTPAPDPTPAPTPETKVAAKKQGGTKHTGGTHATKSTATDPQPAKQPDPAHSGSDELYNPF